MDRRQFLTVATAALAAPSIVSGRAHARSVAGQPLPIPPILDVSDTADAPLEAIRGATEFTRGMPAPTLGYNQPYRGPVLRMRRGQIARPVLKNRLDFPVTAHWHGAHVPGAVDGVRGDTILVNGALQPSASVARGLVRLRLLNGSNARIYTLKFDNGRKFHQIASDGGLLPAPITRTELVLAPAERAEILVDLTDGAATRLISSPDTNAPMGGMMGRGMMGRMMGGSVDTNPEVVSSDGAFAILDLTPDIPAPHGRFVPETLAGGPSPITAEPVRRRQIALQMGPSAMMRGGAPLAINGKPYDMGRIDLQVRPGEVELWEVSSHMMSHPFHDHGTSFTVLRRNGRSVPFGQTGAKDVLLVAGSAEILVRFDKPATQQTPYMFHCHILEPVRRRHDGSVHGQLKNRCLARRCSHV